MTDEKALKQTADGLARFVVKAGRVQIDWLGIQRETLRRFIAGEPLEFDVKPYMKDVP